MKTLCDLFQHHSYDYELYDDVSEEFGTIGILYNTIGRNYEPYDFSVAAEDILEKSGAYTSHHVLYVPNLSDEEILTLSGANTLIQHTGHYSPTVVPKEVFVQLRRNRRSWLGNYLADFGDRSIRAHRLEILAISAVPLVTYICLKSLF